MGCCQSRHKPPTAAGTTQTSSRPQIDQPTRKVHSSVLLHKDSSSTDRPVIKRHPHDRLLLGAGGPEVEATSVAVVAR